MHVPVAHVKVKGCLPSHTARYSRRGEAYKCIDRALQHAGGEVHGNHSTRLEQQREHRGRPAVGKGPVGSDTMSN